MDVTLKFAEDNEHRVHQCYHCKAHFSQLLGSEHTKCDFETDVHDCPPYADASCQMSVTEHMENNILVRDEIRTCSSFTAQSEDCSEMSTSDLGTGDTWNMYSCKNSCTSDLCNDSDLRSPREKHRCYHCTATMNSRGDVITGDEACFNNLTDFYAMECGDMEHCLVDMEADWLPTGEQVMTIRRMCQAQPGNKMCLESGSNAWAYRDCSETCVGKKFHILNSVHHY